MHVAAYVCARDLALGATSDHERKQHHDHWVDPFPHAPSRTSSILPNRVEPYDLFQARELTDPAHHTNLAPQPDDQS
jgi:hypothetical protein